MFPKVQPWYATTVGVRVQPLRCDASDFVLLLFYHDDRRIGVKKTEGFGAHPHIGLLLWQGLTTEWHELAVKETDSVPSTSTYTFVIIMLKNITSMAIVGGSTNCRDDVNFSSFLLLLQTGTPSSPLTDWMVREHWGCCIATPMTPKTSIVYDYYVRPWSM